MLFCCEIFEIGNLFIQRANKYMMPLNLRIYCKVYLSLFLAWYLLNVSLIENYSFLFFCWWTLILLLLLFIWINMSQFILWVNNEILSTSPLHIQLILKTLSLTKRELHDFAYLFLSKALSRIWLCPFRRTLIHWIILVHWVIFIEFKHFLAFMDLLIDLFL